MFTHRSAGRSSSD